MEALKSLGWQKEILDLPPFLIPPDWHQKQKDETLDSPSLLVPFGHTKNKKKNSSIR